ncbi:MAG: ATP-binding protein, partial [Chloroflexales bacterium]|nr:ATP-binding protein [Chloroflexales bacterium]
KQTNLDYNLVYRFDQQGTMLFHYPAGVRSTIGDDFSFRSYFQQAQTSRSPFVSVGRTSPTTARPVVSIVNPLWDEADRFQGLVAVNIELQALSQTLSNVVLQQNANPQLEITIIDPQRSILASLDPDLLLTDFGAVFPSLAPATLPLSAGNAIGTDANGQEHLLSYAPVAEAGWSVVVSRPTEVAFATLFEFQRGFVLLLLLYLGLGVLLWAVLSKQLIRPIQAITSYIQDRHLEAPPRHASAHPLAGYAARSDQVGHLGQSVIDTERVIMARLDELTTLLETSAAVTASLDVETVLSTILVQVEQLLSIDKSAIAAYDENAQRFRVSASRCLSSKYIAQMAQSDSRERLAWQALERNELLHISDLRQHDAPERIAPGAQVEGMRAILVLPLKTIHAQPSVLIVYKAQPHTFTPREINLLSSFANHAAMALENATLYARSDILLKEQTRRLEALVHSLGDGLVLEDLTGNIRYANRWMSEFTGLPSGVIKASSIAGMLEHLHTQAVTTKPMPASAQPNLESGLVDEIFALPHANRIRYLRSEVFEVTDDDAKAIGQGLLLQDITTDYEVDRMKSILISTVSHELRTPLASIKGYASTLLADDVEWDKHEQQEFLAIISREADRLNRLVDELLDMSRLEAGRLKLEMVPCELRSVIARAVAQVQPSPRDRLRIDLPADLPALLADPQRLEVVIRNLVENAVKYADPETPISISAEADNGAVVVQVWDQGPGIPEMHRQNIFDTFYRIDDGLPRQSGWGLGLAICQGFIQAQGGRIWLEPQSAGACIAFSLPVQTKQIET